MCKIDLYEIETPLAFVLYQYYEKLFNENSQNIIGDDCLYQDALANNKFEELKEYDFYWSTDSRDDTLLEFKITYWDGEPCSEHFEFNFKEKDAEDWDFISLHITDGIPEACVHMISCSGVENRSPEKFLTYVMDRFINDFPCNAIDAE